MRTSIIYAGLIAGALSAGNAFAQAGDGKVTQLVPANQDIKAPADKDGLRGTLGLAANFAIAQNSNVVGQLDGVSYLIGAALSATLDYTSGHHEVKNVLSLAESFARTPALDPLVKTNDALRIESIYSYYFVNWAGAFGRLAFESSVFATNDHRAEPTNFSIKRLNGNVDNITGEKKLELSGSFEPISFAQSVGAVLRPVEEEGATITVRAGFGGRETIARGILLNTDDAATLDVVELTETDNVVQGGLEAALGIAGKFPEERLTYGLDLSVLYPILNNDELNRSAGDLIRMAAAAQVSLSTFEWLAIIYQLKAVSDPQLLDEVQVQNNLLLSFKYDIIAAPAAEVPPNPDVVKAQDEAKAANERAAAAEAKAAEMEARALAAEGKAGIQPDTTPDPAPEVQPENQP